MSQPSTLDGIVNLNKPAGFSSRAAVNLILHAAGIRKLKAGHAGTLDPIADGVLVICLGKATRLIPYIHQLPKEYIGRFQLGVSSRSDDVESPLDPLDQPPIPTLDELRQVLPQFTGKIEQVPPIFSAVKVDGKRAYDLARAGESVELKPKTVEIRQMVVEVYEYPFLTLRILCGTGTYIRSLGRDIARSLGTAAVMDQLTRTAVGPFAIDSALTTHDLPGGLHDHILPTVRGVSQLEQITVGELAIEELRHGRPFPMLGQHEKLIRAAPAEAEFAAVSDVGRLVAVVKVKQGEFWPIKFFDATF
jgi:tRNA pseudouridine55 synthase